VAPSDRAERPRLPDWLVARPEQLKGVLAVCQRLSMLARPVQHPAEAQASAALAAAVAEIPVQGERPQEVVTRLAVLAEPAERPGEVEARASLAG